MDINISANTLFHFTSDKNSLLSILKNGLYVRYSLENFETLISGEAEIAFPMTCFCDIPLSQVKRHTKTYGNYAIGLTKSWGMDKKINPVIYTYPKSTTTSILNELFSDVENFFDIDETEWPKFKFSKDVNIVYDKFSERENHFSNKVSQLHNKISHFIRFIKPYEGMFHRNGNDQFVRFYDEREWRFTPSRNFLFDLKLKDSYKKDIFLDPIKRRSINMKLSKHLKLEFKPLDIRFIVVQNENQIPEVLQELEKIFEKTISQYDLKLLGTRLISLEQIIEDL